MIVNRKKKDVVTFWKCHSLYFRGGTTFIRIRLLFGFKKEGNGIILLLMRMEIEWVGGWKRMEVLTFIPFIMPCGDLVLSLLLWKAFGVWRHHGGFPSLFGWLRGGRFSLVIIWGEDISQLWIDVVRVTEVGRMAIIFWFIVKGLPGYGVMLLDLMEFLPKRLVDLLDV